MVVSSSRGRRTWPAALMAVLWMSGAVDLAAQVGAASLGGRVSDASGGPVDGAELTLSAQRSGRVLSATTSADGVYVFPDVAPDAYALRVERSGFQTLHRDRLILRTGETVSLDLTLAVAGLTETLVVSGNAATLRSASSSQGHGLEHATIAALPLNGRTVVALVGLVPGVALPPGSLLPRINGGRPRVNEYLFDGISVLQPEPGQVPFMPTVEAVQEVRIETNAPPAEFGRFNGGVVNLTTMAGGNVLRGTAFVFGRHERLNARNYFAPMDAPRPIFRRGQFGGVVGGAIRPNRVFFFGDYQGQQQTIGRTTIATVPTVLQRRGVFTEPIAGRAPAIFDPLTTVGASRSAFPGNVIPEARLDPVARHLLERYPLPTAPGTANNYRRVGRERADQHQLSGRIDAQFGAGRDAAFLRVTRFAESFVPVSPLPDGSGATTGTLGPQETVAWATASSHRRVLSQRWFHELRAGDTRRHVRRSAVALDGGPLSVGMQGLPSTGAFARTLPSFVIAGYEALGSPPNTASDFATSVTQLANAATWAVGRHAVKVGTDWRWVRLNVLQPSSPTGAFTFSSVFTDQPGVSGTGSPLASFLLGQVQQFSIDFQQEPIRNRAHIQEYFAQDDWRLSDRVTVNVGLRYTLSFPSTEANDRAAVFNLDTRALEYLGRDGRSRSARNLEKLNFGPRLGIVGRFGDRTTVRGAYALIWIEQSGVTTPFTTPSFPFVQTVSQRTLDNLRPAFVLSEGPRVEPIAPTPAAGLGQGVFAVDRTRGSGYVQQWNVSVRRELASGLSAEAAYVGSRIANMGVPDVNLNQLTVEQLARGPDLLARVPNPLVGVVPSSSSLGGPTISVAQLLMPFPEHTSVSLYRNNVGTSRYHGLSTKLERRFAGGFSLLAAYTWSRLMDDASSVFDASIPTGPVANYPVADSFNRAAERDVSNGDIPHVFAASGTWEVPIGPNRRWRTPKGTGWALRDWTVSAILTLQSGTPIAVVQATNANAFAGFGVQRPNLKGDPALPTSARSPGRWFDTEAFSLAAPFTLGTASRNPVRGPGVRNLDVALARRVLVTERAALEVRGEVFNVTNTPALGAPNGVFGSAGFGSITSARDPRVAQLAAKLTF